MTTPTPDLASCDDASEGQLGHSKLRPPQTPRLSLPHPRKGPDGPTSQSPSKMPRVKLSQWQEEDTLCYQVQSRGIWVARRQDNQMINGTKLLEVAGIDPRRRDEILMAEEVRYTVKSGSILLDGVWIPLERALELSTNNNITEVLHPLFECDIGTFMDLPASQATTDEKLQEVKSEKGKSQRFYCTDFPPCNLSFTRSEHLARHVRKHTVDRPFPCHSCSRRFSRLDNMRQHAQTVHRNENNSTKDIPIDSSPTTGTSVTRSIGTRRLLKSSSSSIRSVTLNSVTAEDDIRWRSIPLVDLDETHGHVDGELRQRLPDRKGWVLGEDSGVVRCDSDENPEKTENTDLSRDYSMQSKSFVQLKIEKDDSYLIPGQRGYAKEPSDNASLSCTDDLEDNKDNAIDALGKGKNAEVTSVGLSPSQESPQSDSESSSGSISGLLTRDERKGFLLDRLMGYFFELFASCHSPVPLSVATAGSSGVGATETGASLDSHQNTNDCALETNNTSRCDAAASRKRRLDKDDDDDRRDQGQPDKHKRVEASKRAVSRKLACPYFKKDPGFPQLARSCSGPGWDTVHRIKEHLDRNHALPPSCDRCYTAFKTDADRTAHLRSEIQCQLQEQPSRMHGFDAAQKDQLKGRPRGYKQMSEIQKWCHIYTILFPETGQADIPSPFYNYLSFQDHGHPVDFMVEYDRYLRREMPDRVRQQLEIRIEHALNPVEETLRGQIVEIVREVQNELSQSFRTSIGTMIQHSYSYQDAEHTKTNQPEPQVNDNNLNENREPATRTADNLPNSSLSVQSNLGTTSGVDSPGPVLDTLTRDIDSQLFDFSSLVDLSALQDSTYGELPVSWEEAGTLSLLPKEWSFV